MFKEGKILFTNSKLENFSKDVCFKAININ